MARASLNSVYGDVASGWNVEGGRLDVTVTVPPNTKATVRLPGATLQDVTESGTAVASAAGVSNAYQEGEDVVVEIGSGYSSALLLDVRDQFLGGETQCVFIDPNPERLERFLNALDMDVQIRVRPRAAGKKQADVTVEFVAGQLGGGWYTMVSGMASISRSLATRWLPWTDSPTPPPMVMPSISAT